MKKFNKQAYKNKIKKYKPNKQRLMQMLARESELRYYYQDITNCFSTALVNGEKMIRGQNA